MIGVVEIVDVHPENELLKRSGDEMQAGESHADDKSRLV